MKKDDSIYLDHINTSLNKITDYIQGHDINTFLKSEKTQDAVIRQLEIIGEATKRISKELKDKNFQIPWADMAGMRDKLIHDYIGVDIWVVWETAKKDVPEMMEKLHRIKT